ncbi:N-formylglutamate amidohydrolase [Lichenicoccus sp.]|uniref:N-formylglutamate amidohydrolase n=1 Tax=Lichenicoccus sp. TaxID=2781899 RepID=UPI003D0E3774
MLPDPPFRVRNPLRQTAPMVVASPHSGRAYPSSFVAESRLSFDGLRRSEDGFVDELLIDAAAAGIPLLQAEFPRAYCDVNREAWELDPVMFTDKLPSWCNTSSARVLAGFGTIAKLVASGEAIYHGKLAFTDAEQRIRTCWQPYHDTLALLISNTLDRHGICLLIDAHSMPSLNGGTAGNHAGTEPDFVLGDAFGTSCAQSITRFTERFLRERGYRVRRNDPYAGGYVTRHYGRPANRVHVLQLEISRHLYMNEAHLQKLDTFDAIRALVRSLLDTLAGNVSALVSAT